MKKIWRFLKDAFEFLFIEHGLKTILCIALCAIVIWGRSDPDDAFRDLIDERVESFKADSVADLLLDHYYGDKEWFMDECVEAVGESYAEDYAKWRLEEDGYLVFYDSVGVEEYAVDHLECIALDNFGDCGFTLEDLLEMSGMDAEDALGDLIDIMGRDRVIEAVRNPR